MVSSFVYATLVVAQVIAATASSSFSVKGNKVYDPDGNWVTFRGIGLTCTEYMMKPDMDNRNPYPGYWAYNSCFGGPASNGATPTLNKEPANVLNYLTGDNFQRTPKITKVDFDSPYDQVIDDETPQFHPIIRIPITGSCYLYDSEVTTGNKDDYVDTIDAIVEYFTSQKVAVIIDQHWNCPDTTQLSGCTGGQASMALLKYGTSQKLGSLDLWNTISGKYADNPYVFYELYNEPWIQTFDPWYNGSTSQNIMGMAQMYEGIRKNDPDGIVIIGGASQYALDAQSPLAMYLQYQIDRGETLTNVIWNSHPYQGSGQGLEHSLNSEMRFTLAMKMFGPVIYTEFGQYCCNPNGGTAERCTGSSNCNNPDQAENFVYNVLNFATQYDVSVVGWAWRGNNDDYPCGSLPDCNQPDMRDEDGTLVDGSYGGADWQTVWKTFIANDDIVVEDAADGAFLTSDEYQDQGYLPRPCIMGDYNLGGICGYDLEDGLSSIDVSDITSQSMYDSILPGIPPDGSCTEQGCPGTTCQTYTGPCKS